MSFPKLKRGPELLTSIFLRIVPKKTMLAMSRVLEEFTVQIEQIEP
jgi:hypothetical protein